MTCKYEKVYLGDNSVLESFCILLIVTNRRQGIALFPLPLDLLQHSASFGSLYSSTVSLTLLVLKLNRWIYISFYDEGTLLGGALRMPTHRIALHSPT